MCALTGLPGHVWDARHVISDLFTALDRLPWRDVDPAGLAFSEPAVWGIRNRALVYRPHSLTGSRFGELDPPGLYAALAALPADPSAVVAVPISRQKHVWPWARWGHVATDDGPIPWGDADVARLRLYAQLRGDGFGETALAEPAPRWPILTRLPTGERPAVLAAWPQLAPWRDTPVYLDIAARATRTPKEGT